MSLVVITDTKEGSSYCFDATFKETHSFENQITTNPVQEGTPINDHVYQQPIVFTWDVGMSDCLTSIYPGQFNSSEQRSVAAFDVLESLWENAKLLTITTSFRQHKNMVIKQFVPYRDRSTMSGMRANVVFQQVIVTAATDIAVAAKDSNNPQTTGKSFTDLLADESLNFKTITIPLSPVRKATYNGQTMTIEDYFKKYSAKPGSNNMNLFSGHFYDYTITPIIPYSVTSATTFRIGNDTLSFNDLLKRYGK